MTQSSTDFLSTPASSGLPMGTGISSTSSKPKSDAVAKSDDTSSKSSKGFSLSRLFKPSKKSPKDDGDAKSTTTSGGPKPKASEHKKKADMHLNARHMGPSMGRLA